MSRARFGLLLALLVAVVATASFVVALQLLDDDPSARPGVTATSSSTTAPPPTAAPGDLPSPTYVAIVSSNVDEGEARADAAELTERGYDGAVLRSDDYGSLEPGFWVAYVGPFDDAPAAQAATDDLIADGYGAAYPRCVGTAEDCG